MTNPNERRDNGRPGVVYLVGAGPGDPGLITVRGLRVLRSADVVVYDRLVHPALLDEAPRRAERIFVGKRSGDHSRSQESICAILVRHARAGSVVVRLKGGDPFVFGRGGEECQVLREEGIRYEVVPGVTSAVAAPAAAGIPVTHRDHASAFAVVTGHRRDGASDLDWCALARMPTLVVLMSLQHIDEIALLLITSGADPGTPAAVIANGTLPEQQTVVATLDTIADRVRTAGLESPATLVVGDVVRLHDALSVGVGAPLRQGVQENRLETETVARSTVTYRL